MLDQLLETKPVQHRRTGGSVVSFVLHAAVVAVAVGVTKHTAAALTKPVEVHVAYRALAPELPPVRRAPTSPVYTSTTAPFGPPVLTAPVTIDVGVPAVDLGATPIDAGTFAGPEVSGGRPDGIVGAPAGVTDDAPMSALTVDKAAAALPGSPVPPYPAMLKASGVEGEVLVQFVVDTLGRAEHGSFRVLNATHDGFGESVRVTLPRMRFIPAEAGGRKVRMLVQQKFAFALDR